MQPTVTPRTRFVTVKQKSHSLLVTALWLIPVLLVVLFIILQAALVQAAPPPEGACCNIVTGCCPPAGSCTISTSQLCEFGYQGDGTVCPTCDTTTTTLPPTTTTLPPTTTTVPDVTTTLSPVPICGDANEDLEVTATDALIALKTSVGSEDCPPELCDFNGSGGDITASDALQILRFAVGQVVVPMCPLVT